MDSTDNFWVTYQQIVEEVDTTQRKTKIIGTLGDNCNTE